MKNVKKLIALMLSCALTLTVVVSAASAYDFSDNVYAENAPNVFTTINDDDDDDSNSILSGATAAANTTALSFLGINVTSTDSAGALNSASDPTSPINLLVFGSALNESADPYLWNFYYNLNKYGYPGSTYDMDDYADWEGDYTLLNSAKDGPTGSANTVREQPIYVNGVYKYCDPLFFYEPDVLMGATDSSYNEGLEVYKRYYNPFTYDPLQIGGWTTSEYCLNDGTVDSTFAMANGVYTMAKEIQDYATVNGLESRYNNGSVLQCGVDYSNFALGVYFFVQSRLNPNSSLIGKIDEAGYCTGISIASNGVITVTNNNSLNTRYKQYMDGIAHQVETGKTYASYGDLKKDVDLIFMDPDLLEGSQPFMINHVNIKVVDIDSIMPQTVYGTTMQSADNILGVPYFVGLLYEGSLSNNSESLSEYDYTAYFIKNLYHVKDEDVETVLKAMIGDGCGDTYNGYTSLTNGYEGYINQIIQIGAAYYKSEYMGSGMWQAVDDGLF